MNKKIIENYLIKNGMNPKDRLNKSHGGQYLDNFLMEFYVYVRGQTFDEVMSDIRKLRAVGQTEKIEKQP